MKDNFSVEGALCHFYSKLKKVVVLKCTGKLYFLVSRDNLCRFVYWSQKKCILIDKLF